MTAIRKITHIILTTLLAALLTTGCADSFGASEPELPAPGSICLEIGVPLATSRAVEDDLHEFHVSSLHLYFFRAAGHDDALSEAAFDVAVDGEFEVSRSLRLTMPEDALEPGGLFGPSDAECYVYAVANVSENALAGVRTVTGLKAIALDSEFDVVKAQDSFAMDGFATLTLNRGNRIVSGNISLRRAAAKLTLAVKLPESIDVEERVTDPLDGTEQVITRKYYSRAESMRVWIANGVKNSVLNTPAVEAAPDALFSNEIDASSGSSFTFTDSQPEYKYLQDVPFYSYPNKWDPYSPRGNCYLTLVIPWYYTDDHGAIHNVITYYRLSVRPSDTKIERNTHYDMRVSIGRLGGTSMQQPVDMLFDWNYAMAWNVQTLPTDIKEIRYLLLNNNDFSTAKNAYVFTMENETDIDIPFNSSHPVEIESVEMKWHDYLNNADRSAILTTDGNYTYTGCSNYNSSNHYLGIDVDATSSTLKLTREMLHIAWNNRPRITSNQAFCAYTFIIKLRHTDAAGNAEPSSHTTVEVTQIPAIYITALYNSSGKTNRFVNDNNTTSSENVGSWWNPSYVYYGYVSSTTRDNDYYLGSVHDNYANNKNTYVINISKFDVGDNYIIADPRKRTVDNLNATGTAATAEASWTMNDNQNRKMQYYYPADDDASKTRFIAPQYRVASQWGVTYNVNRMGAKRRCATYQEDGRPAGRWRLPTAAEIEFICRLSTQKYIPYLFGQENETANYWCASGAVDVNNSNATVTIVANPTGTRAVRCVYDEWYWSTDTLTTKNRFHWGDRLRSTSGN